MVKILSWFIIAYKKLLSPVLGRHCRFYPSCSSYTLQALEHHGAVKGLLLGFKRICRCHPLSDGGFDPVPGTGHDHTHTADNHPVNAIDRKETVISHGY